MTERKWIVIASVVCNLVGISNAGAWAAPKTLDDRLSAEDLDLKNDADLLKGLRLPEQDSDQTALDAAVAKEGMLGCHKWLYPSRKELWPVSKKWQNINAQEAKDDCAGEVHQLLDLRMAGSMNGAPGAQ